MSYNKLTRRERPHYLESWSPSAEEFIISCRLCGHVGFKPEVLHPTFTSSSERKATRAVLKAVLRPLQLNAAGLCEICAEVSQNE